MTFFSSFFLKQSDVNFKLTLYSYQMPNNNRPNGQQSADFSTVFGNLVGSSLSTVGPVGAAAGPFVGQTLAALIKHAANNTTQVPIKSR